MVTKIYLICLFFFFALSVTFGYDLKYVGCYKNDDANQVLDGNISTSSNMAPLVCEAKCRQYKYYGLTKSNKCVCGNGIASNLTDSTGCTSTCAGDVFSNCGGTSDIAVYSKPEYYLGCYAIGDVAADAIELEDDAHLKPDSCRSKCGESIYAYAAIKSKKCYCTNKLPSTSSLKIEHECNATCPGGSRNRGCGGDSTVSVYTGKGFQGCYDIAGVTKQAKVMNIEKNFVQHCMTYCKNDGYRHTAVSDNTCTCRNTPIESERLPYERCNTICPGDAGRTCGGPNATSSYKTPNFVFGCMHFPNQDEWKPELPSADMTLKKCREVCGGKLYKLAGITVKNSQDQCFCSNKIHRNAAILNDTQCKPCPDTGIGSFLTCGGPDSISVYAAADYYCHGAVHGDPHYRTFDDTHFSFQGQITYIVVKTTGRNVKCEFELTAKNTALKNSKYAVTEKATLVIENTQYVFNPNGTIEVNGILVTHAVDHNKFKIDVTKAYSQITIKNCGVIIRLDSKKHLDVYLNKEEYSQRITGMLGDCNEDRLNDYRLNNGTNVAQDPMHGTVIGKSFETNTAK